MGFFEWAVQRERNNCENIIRNQDSYTPLVDVEVTTQDYGFGYVKTFTPKDVTIQGHVFNIHGGGLIAGSIVQNEPFCNWLADNCFIVHAIEYPLIPEARFEDQVASVCMAIEMLWPQISNERKYLFADSAGCLLALIANAILHEDGYWMAEEFGYEPTSVCEFDGVWLASPMIETIGFNEIGIFMAKHYYGGKGWRKKPFIDFLKDPYDWLTEYLSTNTVITTSEHDKLYRQAIKLWRNSNSYIGFGDRKKHEHDWNIIAPMRDRHTIDLNKRVIAYLKLN